jgi:hypothetical protein
MAVDVVEKAIFYILGNDATVKALVGAGASAKVFPLQIPQGTAMPAITYEQTTGDRDHTMDGPSGLAAISFAITSWHSTYSGMKALAEGVRLALDGKTGTVGTVKIWVGMIGNELDVQEWKPDLSAVTRFGKKQVYTIWITESTS